MGDFSEMMGLEPIGDYIERKFAGHNYTKFTSDGVTVHKGTTLPGIKGLVKPLTMTSDTFYPNNKSKMEQTKVIERTIQDEQGFEMSGKRYYDHIITVDKTDYHFVSTKKELTAFETGKEATFTTETITQKNGKTRDKIVPVQKKPDFVKNGGGYQGKPAYKDNKNSAVITYLSVLSSVFNGMQQSSEVFNKEKVSEVVEYFYERAKSKSKENDQFAG